MISNLVLRASGKNYKWMYLCIVELMGIPAMSDEPERIFHSAELLISDLRKCLADDVIQASECLKSWIQQDLIDATGHCTDRTNAKGPCFKVRIVVMSFIRILCTLRKIHGCRQLTARDSECSVHGPPICPSPS
jgi:hypothetical protein